MQLLSFQAGKQRSRLRLLEKTWLYLGNWAGIRSEKVEKGGNYFFIGWALASSLSAFLKC